jgi:4-hydroxybenzoate polyprenyltransferase/phosphoserine phosphatase
VDLDGTLLRSDLLFESLVNMLGRRPWLLLALPIWLADGKASLKQRIAENSRLDAAHLPYNQEVLEWLRRQHRSGRRLVLATASHEILAEQVVRHLGIFDECLATTGNENLKGAVKQRRLVARFGDKAFDYAGNSSSDLEVWRSARRALLVDPPAQLLEQARAVTEVERVFDSPERSSATKVLRALRVPQWAKNLLIFVPLLTSHRIIEPLVAFRGMLMFVAFSLASSAVYLANDLLDLEADRHHPDKRRRAFASGAAPLWAGLLAVPLLTLAALAVMTALPRSALLVLAAYVALSSCYSLYLKQRVLLDVFVLSVLYTLRIVAGHESTGVAYSAWLLSFSMFLFLSLALAKRVSELHNLRGRGGTAAAGRSYQTGDLEQLNAFGVNSGFIAALVLALYINSSAVALLYSRPLLLWVLCPLMLYWICRIWILAWRGEMEEDPISFALHDPQTYAIGAMGLAVLVLAARSS